MTCAAVLLTLTFIIVLNGKTCRNHANQPVHWLLVLKAPSSVGGYAYYDSNSKDNFIIYSDDPDSIGHPVYNTFQSINNYSLEVYAWNDQLPNGSTSSSKAHSKTVIAYDKVTLDGVVVVHSMPKYPQIDNKIINPRIQDNQKIYGQHFFCMTTPGSIIKQLLLKSSIIKPFIYSNTNLDIFNFPTENFFQYSDYYIGSTHVKSIYKNGNVNASIFEDGLTVMLKSDLIAETWVRPAQDPWCGNQTIPYRVGNAGGVSVGNITWKQSQDHSKWAVSFSNSSNFSCFGDMNRMASQFKRGGAFYCLEDANLKQQLQSILKEMTFCPNLR